MSEQIIKRDYLIDSFRGLMLVLMTLNHSPLFFRRFTYGLFGYFTAAIGFVFISGYIFSLVYSRYLYDSKLIYSKTYNRVWLIYKYHIGIFIIVFFLHYFFGIVTHKGVIDVDFIRVFYNPLDFMQFFLLLQQPSYFNILPLYIILLFISPMILIGYKNGFEKLILTGSFILWLIFQIPFFHDWYFDIQKLLGLNLGYFNILTWQFLFNISLYIGFKKSKGKEIIKYNEYRVFIAFLLFVSLMLLRHMDPYMGWGINHFIMNKINISNLSIYQMVSFFIVVYFIGGINKYLRVEKVNFLAFLGKYSIDVFVFHIPLVYYMHKHYILFENQPYYIQVMLAFFLILLLALPAILREEIKLKDSKTRLIRILLNASLIFTLPFDITSSFWKSDLRKKMITKVGV